MQWYRPNSPVGDPRSCHPQERTFGGQGGGGTFAPDGMFDPWARRGWREPNNFQLDPDQAERYYHYPERHGQYGSAQSYVQASGVAPWYPEIRT